MALLNKFSPQVGNFEMCTELPPRVNSEGFFNLTAKHKNEALLSNEMPELQLNIAIIFLVSQVFHLILRPFGIPKFVSQMIAGMYLSYVLSYTNQTFFKDQLFSRIGQEILGTLSSFGYILFLFGTAVKMDMENVRNIGRKAILIGVGVVMAPFLCGIVVSIFTFKVHNKYFQSTNPEFFFLAMSQNPTSFAVVLSLLSSLKLLHTELGRVALASSVVADIIGFFHRNIIGFMAVYFSTKMFARSSMHLLVTFGYICVLLFIFRPFMRWIVNRTPEGRPVKDVYIYFIIVLALASGVITDWGEQRIMYWPYFLGLVIPNGPPLGSAIGEKLDCFLSSIFVPLFVTTIAMRVDMTTLVFNAPIMIYAVIVIVLCFVAKCVACLIPCLYYKMPGKDSTALAIIMATKGVVDIALYASLRDSSVISEGLFSLVMLFTLILAFVGPIVVKRLYDPSRKYVGYEKRNIMHLKRNSELKILSCIQKLDDIPAIINLLGISCASKKSIMCVNVLHLIELVGRASPIFISHKMHNKTASRVSYSANVILPFSRFEKDNFDTVQVNVFTTISPYKLMHDDICSLALDKLTSLIIIPFHRKWSINGNIEVEDNMIRALNNNVLQLAPCSIGILISRGTITHNIISNESLDEYIHSICVIFLGGKDDREGLIYAKRMARESNVSLTVIHFIASSSDVDIQEDDPKKNWEKLLDNEVLRDVKHSNISTELNYVSYVEEVVNDGSELALIVRSLINDYNLIICGRRYGVECPQTSGLTEWSEFPELGVIGDLFTSTEIIGKSSILVIQQQMIDING